MTITTDEKDFIIEAEKFVNELKTKGIKATQGIILTNLGCKLVCAKRVEVLAMVSYLLNELYNNGVITDDELDKIIEVSKKSKEEIEKETEEMLKNTDDVSKILDKLKELAEMLEN